MGQFLSTRIMHNEHDNIAAYNDTKVDSKLVVLEWVDNREVIGKQYLTDNSLHLTNVIGSPDGDCILPPEFYYRLTKWVFFFIIGLDSKSAAQ